MADKELQETVDDPNAASTAVEEQVTDPASDSALNPGATVDDGQQADSPTADSGSDTGAADASGKVPKGVQKRIDEVTRQRRKAESEAEFWRTQAMAQQQKPTAVAEPSPVAEKPPREDDFEDRDEYLVAKGAFQAKQAVRAEMEAREQANREQQATQTRQQSYDKFLASVHSSVDGRPDDFAEVALSSWPGSNDTRLTDVIADSDKGPEIAYYLGNNVVQASRISQLSPTAQAREIGKLEAQLSIPASRTKTNAPDPVTELGGNGGPVDVSLYDDKISDEQYRALREKQMG